MANKGGSLLEGVGRLLAPETTQGFLNAPLERQTRSQALDSMDALQKLIGSVAPETSTAAPRAPMQMPDGGQMNYATKVTLPGIMDGKPVDAAGYQAGGLELLKRALPTQYASAVLSRLTATPTAHNIAQGGKVVFTDAQGNEVNSIAGAAAKPDLVTMGGPGVKPQTLNLSDPTDLATFNSLKARGYSEVKTPGAVVNVSNTPENKGRTKMLENAVTRYEGAQAAAMAANKMDANLSMFEGAMSAFDPGIDSGLRLKGQQALSALGIKTDGTAQGELMQRIQRQVELGNTPKGQGQITENERVLVREANNLIGNTPQGSKLGIAATRQLNDYDRRVAKIWRDSAMKHDGVADPVEVDNAIDSLGPPLDPAIEAQLAHVIAGGKGNQGATAQQPPGPAPIGKNGKPMIWVPD